MESYSIPQHHVETNVLNWKSASVGEKQSMGLVQVAATVASIKEKNTLSYQVWHNQGKINCTKNFNHVFYKFGNIVIKNMQLNLLSHLKT